MMANDSATLFGPLPVRAQTPLLRQVFFSHTGQDEKARQFAQSLVPAVTDGYGEGGFAAVIENFTDLGPIERLEWQWPQELLESAGNSMVVVVMLSKKFTQRFWCMLEVDLALNLHPKGSGSRPVVIPVFYDDGKEVLPPEGIKAFWSSQSLSAEQKAVMKVDRWADNWDTLCASPLVVKGRSKKVIVDRVYDAVRELANRDQRPGHAIFVPIQKDLEKTLAVNSKEPLGLWLHGPAGTGKTTMARQLFNELWPRFKYSAYIPLARQQPADVDDHHDRAAMCALLRSALRQLGSSSQSTSLSVLQQDLAQAVLRDKVLFVITNIVTARQLADLLPEGPWAVGSKVIITTAQATTGTVPDSAAGTSRPPQPPLKVPPWFIVKEMQPLSDFDARQFLRTVAGIKDVEPDLVNLEDQVITASAGRPAKLAAFGLKVQGKTSPQDWQKLLVAASTVPGSGPTAVSSSPAAISPGPTEAATKPSSAAPSSSDTAGSAPPAPSDGKVASSCAGGAVPVDAAAPSSSAMPGGGAVGLAALHPTKLSMLLDIADVILGMNVSDALEVWRAWHGETQADRAWQEIKDSGLAGATDGKLFMPNHVRTEARSILLDPSSDHHGSRIWVQDDGSLYGLKDKGIVIGANLSAASADQVALCNALDLSKARIMRIGEQNAPAVATPSLLWLQVQSQASSLEAQGLDIGTMPNLCVLCLHMQQVQQHTEAMARLSHLVKLDLSFGNSTRLDRLPAALGSMTKLRVLDLHGNSLLPQLPQSLTDMQKLEDLDLSYCTGLLQLPQGFGALTALTRLNLNKAERLPGLPEDIGALTKLRHLIISRIGVRKPPHSFKLLPDSFSKLQQLQTLDVIQCRQLQRLCPNFGTLQHLPALDLSSCDVLESCEELLQAQMGPPHTQVKPLSQLTSLNLAKTGIKSLPAGMEQLTSLQQLDLTDCKDLVTVPSVNLPNLQKLQMLRCHSVQQLHIQRLPADNHQELLKDIGDMIELTDLTVFFQGGQSTQLPWDSLVHMQRLRLQGSELQQLAPWIGCMQDLRVLDLTGCSTLSSMPDGLDVLTKLERLVLQDCSALCRLPPIDWADGLVVLDLRGCSQLQSLPTTIAKATKLAQLNLQDCGKLDELPQAMHRLQLKTLFLVGCKSLKVWDRLSQETNWQAMQQADGAKLLQVVLRLQLQYNTVRKLAREQSTMLTSLERMSWVVVLLATATFIGFLQPPGGVAGYDKQVMAGNYTMCPSVPSADGDGADRISEGRLCALLLFFVFDALSFSCSLGCLVMIVVLSMPRPFTYDSNDLEAGRFWWLLLCTWGLLYLAVAFGFGAFVASAWGTYSSFEPWLVIAVLPGFLLVTVGGVLMVTRFYVMSPGRKALRESVPLLCCGWCRSCCGCGGNSGSAVRLEEDVEVGRAPATDAFWQHVGHQLQEGSSRARGSITHLLKSGELLHHLSALFKAASPSAALQVGESRTAKAADDQVELPLLQPAAELQRRPSRKVRQGAQGSSETSSQLGDLPSDVEWGASVPSLAAVSEEGS